MQVRDVMTPQRRDYPAGGTVRDAAERMRAPDIGTLPVQSEGESIGTVTDRDITTRAIATGADPNATQVGNVMSATVFACKEDDDLQEAARIMEEQQVRRLIEQNGHGEYVGMPALADLAQRRGSEELSAEVLEEVSRASASSGA